MSGAPFKLNLSELFPSLAHAPIVEAVISWQARCKPHLTQSRYVQR